MIRGIPKTGAFIHDNCFAHTTLEAAVKQDLRTTGGVVWGNYPNHNWNVSRNKLDQKAGTCHKRP